MQSNTANASGHTAGTGKASDVQISGDVYVSGNVYTGCATFPETSASDCGSVATAAMRETVGTAHMKNGIAYVAIDPRFARSISTKEPYRVFLTADGKNQGIYVDNRTARGFEVRENGTAGSTLDVEYRIVAKPAFRAVVSGNHAVADATIVQELIAAKRSIATLASTIATMKARDAAHVRQARTLVR